MKNTDKLITEVPFPALTICSPGLHMNNVEQHLLKGFAIWRLQNKRNGTTKEAIQKDTEEFMQSRFQIEPTESGEQPIGILDILDTMIAPDVEASVAANGVREHAIACKESAESKKDDCGYSCSEDDFHLFGNKCFNVRPQTIRLSDYSFGETLCTWVEGAKLARISNAGENEFVQKMMLEEGITRAFIGLSDIDTEGTFVWTEDSSIGWKDGDSNSNLYSNWVNGNPDNHNGDQDCVVMIENGRWDDASCNAENRYICSMLAVLEECNPGAVMKNALHQKTCLQSNKTSGGESAEELPAIDIFLNPTKVNENRRIIQEKSGISRSYFEKANMSTLYPELFYLLWKSTLPCFKTQEEDEEHMLVSCELAGIEIECSNLFTRY